MGQPDNFVDEIHSLSPEVKENALGFAMTPDGGGWDNRSYNDVARECGASPGMILGLAATHELGHLLMGSGEHSPSGLMRARWGSKDLGRAARGELQFTHDQIMKLRAGALARIVQQNVPQSTAASR
jgi:hypothetical protein